MSIQAVFTQPQVVAAIVAGCVSLVTAGLTGAVTWLVTRRSIQRDFLLAEQKMQRDFKLEYAAEAAANRLLKHLKWEWRSFGAIKHQLGGFEDDELRKVLVRSGAIRGTSRAGVEMWTLLSRNPELLPPDGEPAPEAT